MQRQYLPQFSVLFRLFAALALLAPLANQAHADDSQLTADQIADRTLRADAFAWEGARTRLHMILRNPDGKQQERSMEVVARRKNGRLQSMVRFSAPQDIAGTAFLTTEQEGGASEQYLYLSGLKRTRRIVGNDREGSFMGSDFTYADMQRIDPKFARNTRLPDENVGEDATFVIETNIKPESGALYSKVVTWVRKKDFVALRTRFFDKQGKQLKTLYAREVKTIEGKPVVVRALMQSENKHSTELVIDSMERKDALPDSLFTPNALEHQ
jgi:hypothetical protein